jgi:hypothetical protein
MGIVPSYRTAWTGADSVCLPGVQSPRVKSFDMVLTAWVPDGPYLIWRSPPLLGRVYPVLELSWCLCMFL